MKDLTIVLPAYNEEESLPEALEHCGEIIRLLPELGVEVVVVDDAVTGVGEERPQVEQHQGSDQDAQQGKRAHAHALSQPRVEAAEIAHRLGGGMPTAVIRTVDARRCGGSRPRADRRCATS